MRKFFARIMAHLKREAPEPRLSRLIVTKSGTLKESLTARQFRKITTREHRMIHECNLNGLDFVSFHEFMSLMPEVANESFSYRIELWEYRQKAYLSVKKGVLDADIWRQDTFRAAIITTLIIEFSRTYVLMIANESSRAFLSYTMCRQAIAKANAAGKVIHRFDAKDHGTPFSILNDRNMSRYEENIRGRSASVSIIPRT